MKFKEEKSIRVMKPKNTLIYFLLDENDEVVYVGQTIQGLIRPFSHRDKEYENIIIIETDVEDLDELENFYILKYRPKYNKTLNHKISFSLMNSREAVRCECGLPNFSKSQLRKLISKLNIQTYVFKDMVYISVHDLNNILDYIKKGGEVK